MGAGTILAVITGGVLSRFMAALVDVALPAISMASPAMFRPKPSVVIVPVPVQLLIPLSASLQIKSTLGSVLCQPLMFAAGVICELIVGAVLSIFNV